VTDVKSTVVLCLLWSILLVAAACGDDDEDVEPSPTPTAASPTQTGSPNGDLKPPDSDAPAAGVCPDSSDGEVTIELHADIPSPRCARVLPESTLRIVNSTGEPVDFELGVFTGSLQPGDAASSGQAVGDFLAPGVHVIQSTAYGPDGEMGGSGEIWLVKEDGETAATYKLIIHRADGTEEILYLTGPPIICGMMDNGDIIELCGTQVDGPAVDFIQVNESLGESYEVIEE
jgi:hypothetical protein